MKILLTGTLIFLSSILLASCSNLNEITQQDKAVIMQMKSTDEINNYKYFIYTRNCVLNGGHMRRNAFDTGDICNLDNPILSFFGA